MKFAGASRESLKEAGVTKQMEKSRRTKTNAKVRLVLRILVALYILYLTGKIIESSVRNTSSLPLWVTVIVSIVFLTGSVAFGIYAWRDYKKSSFRQAKVRWYALRETMQILLPASAENDVFSCLTGWNWGTTTKMGGTCFLVSASVAFICLLVCRENTGNSKGIDPVPA